MIITGLIIFVLLRNKKLLKQNYAYLLIALIAIANFLQLISHFISGFYIVFFYTPVLHFDMFQGSLLNFGYDITCVLNLTLSFNRLFLFFNFKKIWYSIFKKLSIFIVVTLFLASFFYLVISNFEFFKITFNVSTGVWDYYTASENFYRFNGLESKLMVFTNVFSVINLMLIAIKIIIQKLSVAKNTKAGKIKFYDISLFLQAIVNFVCIAFVQIFWQYGAIWFPNSRYLYTYLNYLWLNVGGKDSITNIVLLSEIRVPVLILIGYLKNNTKVVPVPTLSKVERNNKNT
ncbi:7TM GPCR, serpentine receptor class x (Srx) family-containing protein [Strongyloides ratti]|uniref:7TM GPCR, serpentine receptor class x (Srx) family-containing protein n=1 Tax=Strongyloides ratti TaxID=34506 RepID=A0A090LSC9_STRRB|nr:7TM GPCR, serpentine receptor class x (Srx) family-containing protein [Strongyloides ratti]CEF70513.1 7TM GPCR, serpentine receptor class x (Srx) family-containing protein [Strongyloides ratti]